MLPSDRRLLVPAADLATSNPYVVDVRYADDWREVQRDDAIQCLKLAETVRAEVRALLPPSALV